MGRLQLPALDQQLVPLLTARMRNWENVSQNLPHRCMSCSHWWKLGQR